MSQTDEAKMQEKAKWREEYDRMNEEKKKRYEAYKLEMSIRKCEKCLDGGKS